MRNLICVVGGIFLACHIKYRRWEIKNPARSGLWVSSEQIRTSKAPRLIVGEFNTNEYNIASMWCMKVMWWDDELMNWIAVTSLSLVHWGIVCATLPHMYTSRNETFNIMSGSKCTHMIDVCWRFWTSTTLHLCNDKTQQSQLCGRQVGHSF